MYLQAYIKASRPHTLFIALAGPIISAGVAIKNNSFDCVLFILMLMTHILLQILANLANDYGDFMKGTDITGQRIGPMRTLQSGTITPKCMQIMIIITTIITLITGISLLYIALYQQLHLWIIFMLLGILSIISAIKYTIGRKPYGYIGLGDISAFIFFGPVSVIGCDFLYSQNLNFISVLPAIGLGMLIVSVLNINNMRDIKNDTLSNKITIASLLGFHNAKIYHLLLTLSAFICWLIFSFIYLDNLIYFIYLSIFIILFKLTYDIYHLKEHQILNKYLKFTSLTIFILAVSFAFNINLSF